jgi:hypothetical protein
LGRSRTACVGLQTSIGLDTPNPRCAFQFYIDALWAILKKPPPFAVVFVVALNELDEFSVLQQGTAALQK